MAEDLLGVLSRFHREVVLPDIERVVGANVSPLREEMLANFDAILKRLERLESEYTALSAAFARVEQRLDAVEQKIDRLALRAELLELKERVQGLERRIAEMEADL